MLYQFMVQSSKFSPRLRSGIGHRASGIGHRASGIERQLKDGKTNFTFAFSHFTSFNHKLPHCLIASLPHCLIASLPVFHTFSPARPFRDDTQVIPSLYSDFRQRSDPTSVFCVLSCTIWDIYHEK